jgi:drug/metabolite transporter (DMT)-like permease
MPPVGVAAAVLFLGEPLRYSLVGGGAVIVAGLAVIVWPARRTMPIRQASG